MAEGIDEIVTSGSVDAPANSDEAVLAQLETLLSDDGSTNPEPVVEEASDEKDTEDTADPKASEAEDESEDETEDTDSEKDDADEEEEDPEKEEAESDDLELTEEQLVGIFGLDDDGVKIDDEGSLQFKVKVDKEEHYVPLKEMVNSFQFESHIRKKSQRDAEERKEFKKPRLLKQRD